MPHRKPLLSLLARYEAQPKERLKITDFINNNPDCFMRSNLSGHITGSAWLIDETKTEVLLTHHKKLQEWLQLGGHADGDSDILNVALKEAEEESGITVIEPISSEIFDIDVHEIPEYKGVPAHYHYDVRFLLIAKSKDFVISEESNDLAWILIKDIAEDDSFDLSLRRMAKKTLDHNF